jgi:thiamine-phosphate pyrophosphorylase
VPADTSPNPLAELLDSADVACVLLRASQARIDAVRPLVQGRGIALLVANDAALAAASGADGVHLDDPAAYREARRLLGESAIVGVGCGRSRDAAMEVGEAGADYVAFEADTAIIEDWSTMTVVPCVAMGGVNVGNAAALAGAGADFLAVDDAWSHPDGPAAALRAYAKTVGTVRQDGR